MRIYLDNCCFNRPYDDQSQLRVRLESEAKMDLQERIRSGEIELVWSYILDFENEANPFEERRTAIGAWRSRASQDVSESIELLDQARKLQGLGVKNKDCLHLACAIISQCDYFFTTDDGIFKKKGEIAGIVVMNPIDFDTEGFE